MQTNDLNTLTIPEGNVLSIYSNDPIKPSNNFYPVANTFNPDDYEKETEVEIVEAVVKNNQKNFYAGKNATFYITLTDGTVGTEGYVPILYDRMDGVVINSSFLWRPNDQKIAGATGKVLLPKGKHVVDIYVITPEQKIIGPTSFEITVK